MLNSINFPLKDYLSQNISPKSGGVSNNSFISNKIPKNDEVFKINLQQFHELIKNKQKTPESKEKIEKVSVIHVFFAYFQDHLLKRKRKFLKLRRKLTHVKSISIKFMKKKSI